MRCSTVILWLALSVTAKAQSSGEEAAPAQPTAAATESARTHFKLGVDFYRERNFRAALIEFKRAYADAPHYKLLYNLGQASLELQEYANAIEYFTDYLEQGGEELTAERRQEVEESIRYLESRMGQVTIASNRPGAEVYVDDTLVGRVPLAAPVRVGAGRHKFVALEPGLPEVERFVDIAAGDQTGVTLDFEELRRVAPAPPPEPEPAADYVFERERSHTAAIAMGVTTAVLGAGAIALTVLTAVAQQDYHDELDTLTQASKLDELRDDAKAKAVVTDVLWGATLVSGIVTTVLIVTGGSTDAPSEISGHALRVGVGPGGAALEGRF
jgi:tetratricopeptide (TPR) repeat protein